MLIVNSIINPLSEFNILFYNYWILYNFNVSINTIFINLFIINLFFILLIFPFKHYFIPNEYQYIKEYLFKFFLIFLKNKNISTRAFKYYILYANLFCFILFSNLSSLIHFGQSITSQVMITLFLSLTIFCSLITIGFILYKFYLYKIIEPENIPIQLFWFILIIEFFSFLIRPFSLAIRLFVNMLSGHMLLVLTAIFILFICKYWLIFMPFFSSSIMLCLILLEIGVCFIQSYVFVTLILVYFEQIYDLYNK